MADKWFEIADLDHFWVKRRFEVVQKVAGGCISAATSLAEIGCGNGLVQRQIEDSFGKPVDGFDLNLHALQQNVSRQSRLACYDVRDLRPDLHSHYQVVVLFDVLEHIEHEDQFILAVAHLLKSGGTLLINVPACKSFYSVYDEMVGHVRRYSPSVLAAVVTRNGFKAVRWTYWGLPLVPVVLLRRLFLRRTTQDRVTTRGFRPPSPWWNKALMALSHAERTPQHLLGTSIMAVFEKAP